VSASEDAGLPEVVSLLDDEVARTILTETSVKPMAASELGERCDASLPTIYRRLDALEEAELVASRTRVDPDGDHYEVYAARFDRLLVELERGSFRTELTLLEDPADRFTRLFEGIG
jgi:predicted transcriptional regulator